MINAAYLAGVMDSDGSFTVSKINKDRENPSFRPQLQIGWKPDEFSIQFFKDLKEQYGGSWHYVNYTGQYNASDKMLKYGATGVAAMKIVKDILPYLRLKKQQALNMVEVHQLVRPRGPVKRDKETSDRLEYLRKRTILLNSKGYNRNEILQNS